MGKYRAGTADSFAFNERRRAKERRTIRSANLPTGSQLFETTEKVRNMNVNVDEAIETANAANAKADEALAAAKGSEFPIHTVLQMSENTNPQTLGVNGTWQFLTASHIPMTNVKLYLFERIQDDNDS